ncbi:nucleotidyltransferase domain-containing protein [Candidatus Woesearchaeota archaeon]|nr:nucleotidyltransferase domain-containing protein [Candidatus Woesearchaeota archaeon]
MVKQLNINPVEPRDEIEAYQKALHWFFAYPTTEISLTELCKLLKISKTTANRVVTLLVGEGFLKKQEIGNLWRISCNLNHPYNFTRKVAYNILMVYESGVLEAIHKQIPNPKAIVLFGSYRKGDDAENSDLDIAVEVIDDEDVRIGELGVVAQLGYRKNVHVSLHVFSRNRINLNMFANIANGIVLEGFLEVRP